MVDSKGEYISRIDIIRQLCFTTACSWHSDIIKTIMSFPSADVQPVDRWISVDDRVPDISGKYLCYLATGETEVQEFCREINDDEYNNNYPFGCWVTYPSDDGGECREWIEILEITHWQFLPKPPKEGD